MKKHGILVIVLVLLACVAFTTYLSLNASFEGTDDQATVAIEAINPDFEPWFTSVFEPSEILEITLFIAQGLFGTLFVGLMLWLYGKKRATH